MRLFIGIEFDNDVKDYLRNVQEIVKESSTKGNFTLYDNFHLTLRFIGEVNQSQSAMLCDILDEASEKIAPFSIKIGGLNSFNRFDKHIVYVEVLKEKEKLNKLVNEIDKFVNNEFEIRKDKFKPHITIGREVLLAQVSVLNLVTSYDKEINVNKISLMLSERNKQNTLTYTPIYTVNLKG